MSGESYADPILVDDGPPSAPASAPASAIRKRKGKDNPDKAKRPRVAVLATLLAFTDLPTEMIQHIFSLCTVEDLVNLKATCSTFQAAIQGCLFLRKVTAKATLCKLSQTCLFFRIRQMYVPGLLMLDTRANFNHVSKYLRLPVHKVKCHRPQDLSWFGLGLSLVSLPDRLGHNAFVDATVSFAGRARLVILDKKLVEIYQPYVRFWKRDLESKISTAFGNLDMSPLMKPVQYNASTKCYMFA